MELPAQKIVFRRVDDTAVERFLGRVESLMAVLPPRVRDAVELAWQSEETPGYEHMARELAARCGAPVSVVALRQRVSRGMRALERTIRIRQGHADLAVLTRRPG